MRSVPLTELNLIAEETGDLNAICETPRGSHTKYDYEPENDVFLLSKFLPAGMMFPYDFGFFPSTLGEDGDPLDVLILMDEPAPSGTLVRVRVIGAIEAEQTEQGKTVRNDRLIAVAVRSWEYSDLKELSDLPTELVNQVEHFFISYNEIVGKQFKPLGRATSKQAMKLLDAGKKCFGERQNG